jgi:putative ABC transport system substrate-binding protein
MTVRRRDFITLLGGAAATWPVAARAQQRRQMRRIGVIMFSPADDPESEVRVAGFLQGLAELGWTVGQNVQIDYRWGSQNYPDRIRKDAADVLALGPDIILATTGSIVGTLLQLTRTIPIVFVGSIDPVAGGRVAGLARPGGNATGFMSVEYRISTKLLELLKEIAPRTTRVAVIRGGPGPNPGVVGQYAAIQDAAPSLRVELSPVDLVDLEEFQRILAAFAREPNGGVIVPLSALASVRRELIIELVAQQALPAVYGDRRFVTSGGLISYGPVMIDLFRRAASYVDRILKGEKPADLPVQALTMYETVINLKTAKALGLTIPATLLSTADEVIE